MQLSITFRNFEATDSLKEYAREKVDKVNKYLDRAGEAHVVLSLERHLHHADITVYSGAFVLRGKEKSGDMYASMDLAMEKIERQLKRYKDRLKSHHGHHGHHNQAALNKFRHDVFSVSQPDQAEGEDEASPRVIRTNELIANPMTVNDAVMQMDLMNGDFLVFTNSESRGVNVVYRRKDGHYGLIEATAPAAPSRAAEA
jgi:putative sigma-54 modulation protein